MKASLSRLSRRVVVRARAGLRGERALYFVLFVFVGVVGGLVGSGFRWLGMGFQRLYFSSGGSIIETAEGLAWPMRILGPAGGALLAGLIVQYLLGGKGSGGVAEIMEAVALRERSLSPRPALLKSLGSLFLLGSGGSVGREGPISMLSAAISTLLAHVLRLTPARRNILIGCGVASGMAAVYNAPIGASLFVMEVVLANFAMDVFGPLVAASVMATLVSRALSDPGPMYAIPEFTPSSLWEYFILGILGIPCALAGNFFSAVLDRVRRIFAAVRIHPVVKVTLGGALVGTLGIWLPHVWGNGYDAVTSILNGRYALGLVAAVLAGKMLATAISLGSGGLGGVMTPTLLIGAAFGSAAGFLVHDLLPGITSEPGAYALVGMAGVLAATTHAPIMATFLTFELCQDYAMILPLGVCAAVSALMARRWKKESMYTEKLSKKGLDFEALIEEAALQTIRVEDVMWADPPTVPPEMPARDLMERFLQSRRHLMHVVGRDGSYHGLIAIQDMLSKGADDDFENRQVASDLARKITSVSPDLPVARIMEKFWFQEFGELPVVRGSTPPRFAGVVTRRDILGAFDREVLRGRILTARYRMGPQQAPAALPLVGDYAVEEILVPASFTGRTLGEISLPASFQITALALKSGPLDAPVEIIPPPSDRAVEAGDRLLVMGRKEDIARFAES